VTVEPATIWDEARAWLAEDPDPDTRAELARLMDAEDLDAVRDRFAGRLEFGTAGLRGALGAGPNRMNRAVVIRAAAGVTAYLRASGGKAVVVGFDARHKSDQFARDTAATVAGAGLRAMVLPRPLPTPVLAFAVRHLGCDAGVMVTASHNPPQDNGYKVYLGDGSQIVSPADVEISAEIAGVGPLATVPRSEDWDALGDEVLDAYLDRAAGLVAPESPRDVRIAYTPLHGVGRAVVLAAFERAGFPPLQVVGEQAEPDPAFPTVAFPNPEEPGAMDRALALGATIDADVVIANDPDADRCAVAVAGRLLRGDEVGALLAVHLLRRDAAAGGRGGEHSGRGGKPSGTFATTVVSSSLLGKIAQRHGIGYAETLTGFKWLSRVEGLRYAYEEALGYCVDPPAVRDKDGISAALLVAEQAAGLRAEGRSLLDLLDDIACDYGVHATSQLSVRVTDLSEIAAVMAQLRAAPPRELAGRTVTQVADLAEGIDGLPATDAVRLRLGDSARVVIRPSGTEPKLKCYLEAVVPVAGSGSVYAARARAAAELAALEHALAPHLASSAGP
jgi:phosphomannomutase